MNKRKGSKTDPANSITKSGNIASKHSFVFNSFSHVLIQKNELKTNAKLDN